MAVTFDTLKAARRLQDEAGFDEKQAAVLVSTFAEGVGENLATKADLAVLRSDLRDSEARLRAEIESTEARLRTEMRELEQRIYVRMYAMLAGGIAFLTTVTGIATAILLANL